MKKNALMKLYSYVLDNEVYFKRQNRSIRTLLFFFFIFGMIIFAIVFQMLQIERDYTNSRDDYVAELSTFEAQGFELECVEDKIVEKSVHVDKFLIFSSDFEYAYLYAHEVDFYISKPLVKFGKIDLISLFDEHVVTEINCYDNYHSVSKLRELETLCDYEFSTRPFVYFYNETQCIKYTLVKKV